MRIFSAGRGPASPCCRSAAAGPRRRRSRLDVHLLPDQRLPGGLGDLAHIGRTNRNRLRAAMSRANPQPRRLARAAQQRNAGADPIHGSTSRSAGRALRTTRRGAVRVRAASRPGGRLRFLGVKGSVRAPRPSRGRADVGAGRSSDSRAGAPGLLIGPALVARQASTMASESRSPWTLGYSGGTVPDSHRIPCLPLVAGRDDRPPAPVASEIIRAGAGLVKPGERPRYACS